MVIWYVWDGYCCWDFILVWFWLCGWFGVVGSCVNLLCFVVNCFWVFLFVFGFGVIVPEFWFGGFGGNIE